MLNDVQPEFKPVSPENSTEPAFGVHPLVMQKRDAVPNLGQFWTSIEGGQHEPLKIRRNKPSPNLFVVIVGVMLFLAGFAYGLRLIDQRFGGDISKNRPAHEIEGDFDYLADGARFILGIKTAQAAEFDAARFKAEPLNRYIEIEASPGEIVPVEIFYRNLGSATWSPEGRSFISVYTTQPRYHAGVFRHRSWMSSSQPARLSAASVPPGAVGVISFMAQAPEVAGEYSEWLQLAAEDTAWVWGAHVKITMRVAQDAPASVSVPATTVSAPAAPAPTPAPTPIPSGSTNAMLLLRSARDITSPANTAVSFTAGFKNTGDIAWDQRGLQVRGFTIAAVTNASLYHSSWASSDTPVTITNSSIQPGQIGFLNFTLTTPKKRGSYNLRLGLVVNGSVLENTYLDIPITVTNDYVEPRTVYTPPTQTQPTTVTIPSDGGTEPNIKVGLYYSEIAREEFVANVPYEVRSGDGVLLASLQAGAPVQAWYDASTGKYRLTNGIIDITSPSWLRFVPLNSSGIFTLLSHSDRPSWNSSLNDNRFRGTIELRRHSSGRVWVINELSMEQYLWGLAETSNNSPTEFMKALAVAARSYGNWHLEHPGKYDHFTVGAINDQVYKGYGAELRYSRFKAAVEATRGQVVTYNGDKVITPYYSWSDGRTRAWTEVWGGSHKPWLVSVSAPHDNGKTLYGHGVGMSAWDAIGRANDGFGYDEILAHYYTGTALRKLYN